MYEKDLKKKEQQRNKLFSIYFNKHNWSFFETEEHNLSKIFVYKYKWSKSCHDNTAFTEHNYGDQCKKSNKNKTEEIYIWKKKR